MANKIYVGNISQLTTEKDLFNLFSLSGQVLSVKIALSIDEKKNAGYGYITMNNYEDVKKAILRCNNTIFKEKKIRVTEAHIIDQEENYLANKNRFRRNRRF